MAEPYGEIVCDFSLLDKFAKVADDVGDEAVRLLAFEGLARSSRYLQSLVYTRSHDDERQEPTGALLNSGYVRTSRDDFTHQGEGGAVAKNPNVTFGTAPPSPQKGEAQILYAVEYAVYVHEGTRYMTGRQFLRPAVEELKALWAPTVTALLKRRGG